MSKFLLHKKNFFLGFELSFFSGEFPLLMDKKIIGAVMTSWGVAEVFGNDNNIE
jgi:hypothetical protein